MAVTQRKRTGATPILPKDTTGWLTREQASDLLGVAIETLRLWERRGFLHPGYVRSNKYCRDVIAYDPEELSKIPTRVRSMPPRRPDVGELHAMAFALFDAGRNLREVVIELRIPIHDAEALREAWLDVGGFELAIAPAAKEDLEGVIGPFATVAELVERVRERIKAGASASPAASTLAKATP